MTAPKARDRPGTYPPGGAEPGGDPAGRIVGLYRKGRVGSERGLPKLPIDRAQVGRSGVKGDFNRYRHEEKSDDPGMALLLMPSETLGELVREGWPVSPGDLGENVATGGIPYADLAPGSEWWLGGVRVRIEKACTPCTNLYGLSYVGPRRGPEFLRTMLGRRGWYARVVVPGPVRVGDAVRKATGSDPSGRSASGASPRTTMGGRVRGRRSGSGLSARISVPRR